MSARASIHAMFPLDETATAELDARLDGYRMEARNEAAAWFASYPFPSAGSDWERGRDDTVAWAVRCLRDPDPQRGTADGEGLDVRLNEHAAKAVAERDAQIIQWLVKKGREFYAASRKAERAQGDTCAVLASKITRGAVRPDNLRMLPTAGFFEVDHTYTHGGWQFRCDAVTTHPETGELTALGWTRVGASGWTTYSHGVSEWGPDWTDVTEAGESR